MYRPIVSELGLFCWYLRLAAVQASVHIKPTEDWDGHSSLVSKRRHILCVSCRGEGGCKMSLNATPMKLDHADVDEHNF